MLLLVMTDGRAGLLEPTLESLHRMVPPGTFSDTVICDDSGNRRFQEYLRASYPDATIECGPERLGFARATQRAQQVAAAHGGWVFWTEDDFTFTTPFDLADFIMVMDCDPRICQMALRRQAWFPSEVAAGGVLEVFQDTAVRQVDQGDGGLAWIEHRLFWTQNPNLQRTADLVDRFGLWPLREGSEACWTRRLLELDPALTFSYWGRRQDPPWIIHEGRHRIGEDY